MRDLSTLILHDKYFSKKVVTKVCLGELVEKIAEISFAITSSRENIFP